MWLTQLLDEVHSKKLSAEGKPLPFMRMVLSQSKKRMEDQNQRATHVPLTLAESQIHCKMFWQQP
jgi:hypothetical protein